LRSCDQQACFITAASPEALPPSPKDFELEEITISELQAGMQSGKYTSDNLVRDYLRRIDDVDKSGPKLNSVIEINPEARDIASDLDRERRKKARVVRCTEYRF